MTALSLIQARTGARVALIVGCTVDTSLSPLAAVKGSAPLVGTVLTAPDAKQGVPVRWDCDGSWSVCRAEQLELLEAAPASAGPDPLVELEAFRAKDAARDERAAELLSRVEAAEERSRAQTAALVALSAATTPEERAAALRLAGVEL